LTSSLLPKPEFNGFHYTAKNEQSMKLMEIRLKGKSLMQKNYLGQKLGVEDL
jgi:hypothetical protein